MTLQPEITVPVPSAGELISINPFLAQLEDGGTLILKKGKYCLEEGIVLERSARMVGKGIGKTILCGEKFETLFKAHNIAKLSLEGISFSATGKFKSNVLAFSGEELEMTDCAISGAKSMGNARYGAGLGAVIATTKMATLTNINFENNDQTGLTLGEKTVAKITDCAFDTNMYGIKLSDKASAYLSKCDFVGNSYSGLSSMSAGLVWVKNSRFHENGSGIEVLVKANVEIKDCTFNDNERAILVSDNGKVVAEKNLIHQNQQPILMTESANGEFSHNQIHENTQTGISLNGKSKGVFRFNTIYDNEFFDVGLTDACEAVFTKNSFSDGHKEETIFFLAAGPVQADIRENYIFTTVRPLIYVTDLPYMQKINFQGNYNTQKKEIFLEEYSAENETVKIFLSTIKSPEEKEREKEKKLKAQAHKNVNREATKSFTGDEWREYNENLDKNPLPDFVFRNVELSLDPDTKRFVLFKKTSLFKE